MLSKHNLIVCKVRDCGYHSPSNFCLRPLTFINERGFCGYVYDRNNNINSNYTSSIDVDHKLNFGAERFELGSQGSSGEIGDSGNELGEE